MKKWLVRVLYHESKYDLVAIVKTKDIEKYMNNYVRDILDLIVGYEYQELRYLKRNEIDLLCGAHVGADCIKEILNMEN